MTSAFLAGLLGGLAVALPLGAIGLLIMQTGMGSGWRPAAAGATGVAFVDFVYAVTAVSAGAVVSRWVTPHEHTIKLAGAAVLLAVAIKGLLSLRKAVAEPAAAAPGRAFLRFAGL